MNKKGYHIINFALGSVVIGIVLYSFLFRGNNHPIPALLTDITGIIPPSKGLSASFSEIVRGNIDKALLLNHYSLRVFAFFIIQFLTRILVSIVIHANWIRLNRVAIIDIIFSILLFVICFAPLIEYTIQLFSKFL